MRTWWKRRGAGLLAAIVFWALVLMLLVRPPVGLVGRSWWRLSLVHGNFDGAGARYLDLRGRNLSDSSLRQADLTGAKLQRATLTGADLTQAFAPHARFRQADCTGARFTRATLSYADFSGAVLIGADLSGAELSGTCFCGADLRGAHLRNTSLAACLYDRTTRWPDGLDIRSTGALEVTSGECVSDPSDVPQGPEGR